jgi:hypothetical protein
MVARWAERGRGVPEGVRELGMSIPTYASCWNASDTFSLGQLSGASERLVAAVRDQIARAHQSVRQALAVLHARGMNVEGFDAVSSRYRCPLPVNLDLRVEAVQCDRPWSVEHYPLESRHSAVVETLVVGDRAGQAVEGVEGPIWGDWDDAAQHLVTDGGLVVRLDGTAG